MGYFELGEPPFDDVEEAAKLWAEYIRKGLVGRELGSMFPRMVKDFEAVDRRASELLKQSPAPTI